MQPTPTANHPTTNHQASTPASRPTRPVNHQTAIFLVICLGLSGSGRFYLGYRWSGIAKLACNAGFLLALIVLVVYFTSTVIDQLEFDHNSLDSQSQSVLVAGSFDQVSISPKAETTNNQVLERDDNLFQELSDIYLEEIIGLDGFKEIYQGFIWGLLG